MKIPEVPPLAPDDYDYGRVLDDLVQIGKFREFMELNETTFEYWEKWKYISKTWGYDARKLWAAVKTNRYGIPVQLTKAHSFRLNFPSVLQEYLHRFDMNLGGSIQGKGIIPSEEKERYLLSSLMEEAIASSQLEGAVTTRKLAKEMLETNRQPRNESEQMILNNYEGMKWIVANKDKPFTIENILELHSIISRSTLANPKYEGAFRTEDNVNVVDVATGEVIYHPPSHRQLSELMEAFCDFANDKQADRVFIHPIVKGISLHFFLGYIHPFVDGNGRTARTLFYWYLVRKGYWLIEYMSVSRVILEAKAQYARAYLHTELDNNELTYFVLYNLKCMKIALEELRQYIERESKEKKRLLNWLRHTDFNDRQIYILQTILSDQVSSYTVRQIERWFNISNQTARNDLARLVELGLLQYRKSGRQMVFFPRKDFDATLRKISAQ